MSQKQAQAFSEEFQVFYPGHTLEDGADILLLLQQEYIAENSPQKFDVGFSHLGKLDDSQNRYRLAFLSM